MPRLWLEKRKDIPWWIGGTLSVFSVVLALGAGGGLLLALGVSPWEAYVTMFRGALGNWYGLSETVVKAIPLAMAGLAVSLAFRMQVWNIGAEGQILLGALATAATVRYAFVDNFFVMLFLMMLSAALAGGLWGALAGWLKGRWRVNEIISTLMMNYIALHTVDYFIYGPWRDPASLGFPMTAPFPPAARLPLFLDTRVHLGIFFALILAGALYFFFRWTRWGFEVRVLGENPQVAHYAGIPYVRNVVLLMFFSGALAGLAGMGEIAGLQGRMQPGFSPGYGYTAIIVAWLARLNPGAILGVAFFLGALLVGGDTLQVVLRLPLASTHIIQGCILIFLLGGDVWRTHRIRLFRDKKC